MEIDPQVDPSGGVHRARWLLIGTLGLTLLLYVVPFGRWFAYPLILLSTLVHELGHGVAAMIVGGRFHQLAVWPDGSGTARWSGDVGPLGQATVAAGGLLGPAVAAALLFALGRTQIGARRLLWALALSIGLVLVCFVRNAFGLAFTALFALACLGATRLRTPEAARLVLVFLAVQLSLSVFSRSDYLFVSEAQTAAGLIPSDVSRMSEALWLPYWFWGSLCGTLSLIVLANGLRLYWR